MVKHQQEVMEAFMKDIKPTCDMFIMPYDIQNIAKNGVQELWKKHKNDALIVCIWIEENRDFIFMYQEHE